MNKKGFTLIELIAVVVIMAIIALIATPNIVSMVEKGKKSDYASDVKEFVSKATYLYKQEKYREDVEYFQNGQIKLEKLNLSEEELTDPYGNKYDLASTITFVNPDPNTLAERKVSIDITSCGESNGTRTCYTVDLDNVNPNEIDNNAVKKVQ